MSRQLSFQLQAIAILLLTFLVGYIAAELGAFSFSLRHVAGR